jgi:hypothetical protein
MPWLLRSDGVNDYATATGYNSGNRPVFVVSGRVGRDGSAVNDRKLLRIKNKADQTTFVLQDAQD